MRVLRPSADLLENVAELKLRLVTDGYLYLPDILPVDEVVDVRDRVCRVLYEAGWLTSPTELRLTPERRFTRDSLRQVYPQVQSIEECHRLAHVRSLMKLMKNLLGDPTFCHPAKAIRLAAPTERESYVTWPHQDFAVLHVAVDVLTAWIPLTDCSVHKNGLRLVPGSHINGFLPTIFNPTGTRPIYVDGANFNAKWATAPYRPGDLVVFHSLTVHCGGPNMSNNFRLSVDARYQSIKDPLREEFAYPHGWPNTPDWDELCAGWTDRQWARLPCAARVLPMPSDVSYYDYLNGLEVPPSRLFKEADEEKITL